MTMVSELKERIESLIIPILDDTHVELVEFRIKHRQGTVVMDILVDKPQGGVTLKDCSQINRQICERLEENPWLTEGLMVEVSSPGLDRPLKIQKDFQRVLGKSVRFYLLETVENKLEWTGILEKIEDTCVIVDSGDITLEIPLVKISKAVQIYAFA